MSTSARYETCKLKSKEITEKFRIELRNRFSVIEEQTTDNEVEPVHWKFVDQDRGNIRNGSVQKVGKDWRKGKKLKEKMNAVRYERNKEIIRTDNSDKGKEVKKGMRRAKRMWTDELAKVEEKATQTGNMKCVFDVTKKLCKDQLNNLGVVKSKDGTILSKTSDILPRCIHHFTSDLIHNMDHMRISGTEPSSMILSPNKVVLNVEM